MKNIKRFLSNAFNLLPLSNETKVKAHIMWAEYKMQREEKQDQKHDFSINADPEILNKYVQYILSDYGRRMPEYETYRECSPIVGDIYLSALLFDTISSESAE